MKLKHWCGSSANNGLNGTPSLGFQFQNFAHFNGGFTLIEVLVVTIILGIALSLAVANLMPDEREKVRTEAERILILLEQVRDESAMSGKAIALEVSENSMQFFERDQKSVETRWLPLAALNGSRIEARPFARGTIGELHMGSLSSRGAKSNDTLASATATFQPAGVSIPFELKIQSAASAINTQTIRVDALGNLSLTTMTKDAVQ